MSKLIDRATAHFQDVLAQGLKGPISVPEWDAQVYYRPSTTLAEENKIIELTQKGKTTEALVWTLIQRARDKDDKMLFDASDVQKLLRGVDPKIILSIVTRFNEDETVVDEALGN